MFSNKCNLTQLLSNVHLSQIVTKPTEVFIDPHSSPMSISQIAHNWSRVFHNSPAKTVVFYMSQMHGCLKKVKMTGVHGSTTRLAGFQQSQSLVLFLSLQ